MPSKATLAATAAQPRKRQGLILRRPEVLEVPQTGMSLPKRAHEQTVATAGTPGSTEHASLSPCIQNFCDSAVDQSRSPRAIVRKIPMDLPNPAPGRCICATSMAKHTTTESPNSLQDVRCKRVCSRPYSTKPGLQRIHPSPARELPKQCRKCPCGQLNACQPTSTLET